MNIFITHHVDDNDKNKMQHLTCHFNVIGGTSWDNRTSWNNSRPTLFEIFYFLIHQIGQRKRIGNVIKKWLTTTPTTCGAKRTTKNKEGKTERNKH
tara:strand:+ start:161 stop:448 length:288 start_codon:yes stop_codon:yes gene_type:complete